MKSGLQKLKLSGNCVQDRGKDRLSELPDEVIVHILSFLPTLDAVRTVLLRRFGSLWTLVSTLNFWDHHFRFTSDEDDDTALESRFALFVRNVLILHKRPTIDDFFLRIDDKIDWDDPYAYKAIAEVEMWIRFALSRDVKALTLLFQPFYIRGHQEIEEYFPLPACIYTSHSLVMLDLDGCGLKVPSRVHMGSLTTLDICNVVVGGKFDDFLIGCPSLKTLTIINAYYRQSLRSSSIEKLEIYGVTRQVPCIIDCPNLKILIIDMSIRDVEVFNIPSVRKVTVLRQGDIFCEAHLSEKVANKFRMLLEGFQSAEVVDFGRLPVDRYLTYCLMLNEGFPENRWKRVILDLSMQDTCIAGIYSLVRNSPCLEELNIRALPDAWSSLPNSSDVEVEIARKLVSREASSPCVVPCLKVVSIYAYEKTYEGQFQLVEFLLKSAVNLDKLEVFCCCVKEVVTSVEKLLFVERLSKVPRASPKAMIVFQ